MFLCDDVTSPVSPSLPTPSLDAPLPNAPFPNAPVPLTSFHFVPRLRKSTLSKFIQNRRMTYIHATNRTTMRLFVKLATFSANMIYKNVFLLLLLNLPHGWTKLLLLRQCCWYCCCYRCCQCCLCCQSLLLFWLLQLFLKLTLIQVLFFFLLEMYDIFYQQMHLASHDWTLLSVKWWWWWRCWW